MSPIAAVISDFGGVLTSNVFKSFADFCRDEGLDPDRVKQLFRGDDEARDLLWPLAAILDIRYDSC